MQKCFFCNCNFSENYIELTYIGSRSRCWYCARDYYLETKGELPFWWCARSPTEEIHHIQYRTFWDHISILCV